MSDKVLNKKQFMQQYCLNLSISTPSGIMVYEYPRAALDAWEYIEKECKDETSS